MRRSLHMRRSAAILVPAALAGLAGLASTAPAAAQVVAEPVDLAVTAEIRAEGLERSGLDALAHELTDRIGPRLTGSSGMRRANDWTAGTFRDWGLTNVVVEPWGEFGRGWEEVSFAGRMVKPYAQPLHARAVAWTDGTGGPVRGPVVVLASEDPDALAEEIARRADEIRGAFVLAGPPPAAEPDFDPAPLRQPLEELLAPPAPPAGRPDAADRERRIAEFRARRAARARADSLLDAAGAAVRLVSSSRSYQLIRGGGDMRGRDPERPVPGPTLVVSREDYGRMWRLVTEGTPVELEVDVRNRFLDDDLQGYNTLADLPGGERADELVMIGGHLDSWHYGTGATDNAAGSIVMMEAMRILASLDRTPRRTIRIGLWGGEEQGLLGSRGWVAAHPELHDRISAYLNLDNGTGRIRGIWSQSNERVVPIFEQILWPFRDLGVVAVKHGDTGGTDHLAFDAAGIPGFNFIQDPIEYGTRTHHTAADTHERLLLDDLRQAAVVVAATAWHLANREEMVPRKPAGADGD
ncbi:MAG: M20/M25/M40 family metallo-hydrolase [Gemmatimonadota bacterium]|nr:M20/M25/M40 family metallo-hydrolase [Gemmatimonadota bacterium]